jgi:hypothetical protein
MAGVEVQNPAIKCAVEPKSLQARAAKFTGDLLAKNYKEDLCESAD